MYVDDLLQIVLVVVCMKIENFIKTLNQTLTVPYSEIGIVGRYF